MSEETHSFSWPSAPVLVERAERSLQIHRPPPPDAIAADSLVAMRLQLSKLAHGSRSLVPPGYESSGRLPGLKRTVKKVTRPFMWWYVEPRWIVQRDLATELTTFAASSIRAVEDVLVELSALRLRVHELEQQLAEQSK